MGEEQVDRTLIPIQEAPFTWKTLEAVAGTEFVPKALRNKPAAILACVLTGREMGLGPFESMRMIDVIEGQPSPSGELMGRMIRANGHRIKLVSLSQRECVLEGIRGESADDTMEVSYSIEDAQAAGLTGKSNWKKYPKAMLYWRALSMLARMQFPDAIAGRMYTAEELGSEDWVEMPQGYEDGTEPETATVTLEGAGYVDVETGEIVDKEENDG